MLFRWLTFSLTLATASLMFVFTAKLGKTAVYAHIGLLCLLPLWIILVVSGCRRLLLSGKARGQLFMQIVSCLTLPLFLIVVSYAGTAYRKHLFRKHLPAYQSVITIANAELKDERQRWLKLDIPTEYRSIAMLAAAKKQNGILAVKFLISGHFPARHFGYLYLSDQTAGISILGPRTRLEKLPVEGWFEFYD